MRLKNSGVQIILIYMALFSLSVFAVLFFVYWQTAQLLQQELDSRVGFEVDRLQQIYARNGAAALVEDLQRSADNPRAAIYWLVDDQGVKLAGTLDRIPQLTASQALGDGRISFSFSDQQGAQQLRGRLVALTAGEQLFVGHDFSARDRLTDSFLTSSAFGFLGVVGLGAFGGWAVMRRTRRRLGEFNQLAERVMAGHLDERMNWRRRHDEYDQIGDTINHMLERIEDLVTAMREVGENIAHDLRTPLTRVRHQLELMTQRLDQGQAVVQAEIDETLAQIDGIIDTFNGLLMLGRLETGVTEVKPSSVDLSALVEEMVELYEPAFEATGAEISCQLPSIPAYVHGNPALIQQAVANIMENALHYGARANGCIRVQIERRDATLSQERAAEFWVVTIEDNGAGIEAAQIDRALRRFGRLDPSRHRQGNGLGLPIVKAIMERHGGYITLGPAQSPPTGLRVELGFIASKPVQ